MGPYRAMECRIPERARPSPARLRQPRAPLRGGVRPELWSDRLRWHSSFPTLASPIVRRDRPCGRRMPSRRRRRHLELWCRMTRNSGRSSKAERYHAPPRRQARRPKRAPVPSSVRCRQTSDTSSRRRRSSPSVPRACGRVPRLLPHRRY